ncbi:MAG: hypothetical protein HY059_09525 [Proteobacteria bacterium]|nr:hypothetical protein [Pseudomonadota bacterium]
MRIGPRLAALLALQAAPLGGLAWAADRSAPSGVAVLPGAECFNGPEWTQCSQYSRLPPEEQQSVRRQWVAANRETIALLLNPASRLDVLTGPGSEDENRRRDDLRRRRERLLEMMGAVGNPHFHFLPRNLPDVIVARVTREMRDPTPEGEPPDLRPLGNPHWYSVLDRATGELRVFTTNGENPRFATVGGRTVAHYTDGGGRRVLLEGAQAHEFVSSAGGYHVFRASSGAEVRVRLAPDGRFLSMAGAGAVRNL